MKKSAEKMTPDFKRLFESSPGLFLVLLPDVPRFTIVGASDAYLRATMTKRKDITGRGLFEVFPDNPADKEATGTSNLRRSLQTVLSSERPHTMAIQKYDIRRPDGTFEERHWSPVNSPVSDENGKIEYIIHQVEDVTEQVMFKKPTMEEIAISRGENAAKSQALKDNQERINNILSVLLKYTIRDFTDKMEISEKADELDAIAVGLNTLGEELESYIQQLKKSEERLERLNADLEQKVIDRTGEVVKSEKRFRALIENTYDAITLTDKNGRPVYQSPSAERMTGWTLEERQAQNGLGLIHPEDREQLKEVFEQVYQNPGTPFDVSFRIVKKDGEHIWAEGTATNLLHEPAVGAIVSNYRDVTERRKAHEQSALLSAIVNSTDDAIFSKSLEGTITSWNQGAEHIFGYGAQEIVGKSVNILIPEALLDEEEIMMRRLAKGESFKHFETIRIRKNGSTMYASLTVSPLRDASGEVVSASIVLRDVSDRVKAREEIEQLNATLEQKVIERTAQLEAVNKELESFSYSVSHDLRAPLRAIDGYARIIEEDYFKLFDDEGKRLFSVIQYNAKKMGSLIDDLLSFSRLGRKDLNKMKVNMNELVEGAILELEKSVKHNARIKLGELGTAAVDYGLISQVMVNLISNAIKYSSKNPQPQISINADRRVNEVIYSVADNGVGFDMKYAGKLFGVFQRLHSEADFEGTGVGLAIVQRIINKHGGRVWAEAKPNAGATFYFSLPLKQKITQNI